MNRISKVLLRDARARCIPPLKCRSLYRTPIQFLSWASHHDKVRYLSGRETSLFYYASVHRGGRRRRRGRDESGELNSPAAAICLIIETKISFQIAHKFPRSTAIHRSTAVYECARSASPSLHTRVYLLS